MGFAGAGRKRQRHIPVCRLARARSTLRRLPGRTRSARPSGDESDPSILSESDSRVRLDPGTLFAMGRRLAQIFANLATSL